MPLRRTPRTTTSGSEELFRIRTAGSTQTACTPQDFTHDAKVLGTYHFPKWGGFNVSGFYRYQSGRPWARSVFFGPQTEGIRVYVEPAALVNWTP